MVVGGPLQGNISRSYPTSHCGNKIIVFKAQVTAEWLRMVVGGPFQGKFPRSYPQSHCVNKIIIFKTHIKGMAVGGPLSGIFFRPYPSPYFVNKIIVFKTQVTAVVCLGESFVARYKAKSPDPIQHLTVSIKALF